MQEWSSPGNAAVDYAELIYHRVRDGMLLNEWSVDWTSQPYTHSFYPDAAVVELAVPDSNSPVFTGVPGSSPRYIADLLFVVYGVMDIRLALNRNDAPEVFRNVQAAKYGRNTPSGGGRYGADFFLLESGRGAADGLQAGIYHYSPVRHCWEQIARGDYSQYLAHAQGYDHVADRYIVTTINYWRSGFKYNDFAYQATAMDIGTVVGSVSEVLGTRTQQTWDMWVNETELARLLDIDRLRDGIYAVQGWGGEIDLVADEDASDIPEVSTPERIGSKHPNVVDFATTKALQFDMAYFPPRPETLQVQTVSPEAGTSVGENWWQALRGRQSSFGRFTGAPYPLAALKAMLVQANEAAERIIPKSTDHGEFTPRWQFLVYVHNLEGHPPGLYRFGPDATDLELLSDANQDDFLASTYFLNNYDGRKAAATIILCGNVIECAQHWGVRGYRLMNAIIGAMCQAISVEAVRQNLSTGTALGFDCERHANHAGLDKNSMTPMLMTMTGVDHELAGAFHANVSSIERS